MIENNVNYCKIMNSTPEERSKSLQAILWIGQQAAERLVDEPRLEVRKHRSGLKNMEHCVVVMCSKSVLWNIPNAILQACE